MRHHRARLSAAVIFSVTASLATISLAGQSQTSPRCGGGQRGGTQTDSERRRRSRRSATGRDGAAARMSRIGSPGRTPWGDPDLLRRLLEQRRERHSVRAAGAVQRPSSRGHHRPRNSTSCASSGATPSSIARPSAVEDPRRSPAVVLVGERSTRSSSRAWLVVDPPDGRIPPHDSRGAEANGGATGGTAAQRPRPGRGAGGSQSVRPVHLARPARIDDAAIYGSSYPIVQGPNTVAITYEMIHETRIIPLDGRPHLCQAHPQVHG